MKKLLYTIMITAVVTMSGYAQELSLGADLVSRYVWRGTDFGSSASVQPGLSVAFGSLEIGTWASYSLVNSMSEEHDFYISYGISDITLAVTDYYYPSVFFAADQNYGFFNFDDDGNGAHVVEVSAAYSSEGFPLSLLVAYNVYNDVDDSFYAEASYAAGIFDIFLGLTTGSSAWYGVAGDGIAVINAGITASKDIPITESFTLPLFGQVILNAETERSFFVIGVSL